VEQLFPLDDAFVMNQLAFQPKIETTETVEPPLAVSFQAEQYCAYACQNFLCYMIFYS